MSTGNAARTKETSGRNVWLDFIKLLCCVIVLCSHSRGLTDATPEWVDTHWIAIGTPVVQCFFGISGFFLVDSFVRRRDAHESTPPGRFALTYTTRKFLAIAPYYWAAFLLWFVNRCIQNVRSASAFVKLVVLSIPEALGLSGVGLDYQYFNSVTRYISAMLVAILLCAYLLKRNSDFYLHVFAPLAFLLLLCYEAQVKGAVISWEQSAGIMLNSVIRGVEGVCSGAVAWLFCQAVGSRLSSGSSRALKVLLSLCEALGWLFVAVYCFGMKTDRNISLYLLPVFPFLIGLSASGETAAFAFFRALSRKLPTVWFSKASLLLYLNHMFVKTNIIRRYFRGMGFWKAFPLYLLFTALISGGEYGVIALLKRLPLRISGNKEKEK